jgi:hypothetical protein
MIMFVALCSRRLEVRDTFGVESEHVCQDLVRMLAQKRRPFDLHFVARELPGRPIATYSPLSEWSTFTRVPVA